MENRMDGSECISRENGKFFADLMGPTLQRCEWSLGSKYHTHLGDAVSEPAVCLHPIHTQLGEKLKEGGTGP